VVNGVGHHRMGVVAPGRDLDALTAAKGDTDLGNAVLP
jgi:hypothetical protein